jgi:penicillin amidase
MTRVKRVLLVTGAGVVLLVGGTVVTGWAVLRASLPRTSGHVVVAGMSAPVEVTRDALGIPTIVGATALDVARAQGFVHAQDRYFQMDLTRRYAAGELTGLFGDIAADNDARMRVFQYRLRAGRVLPGLPPRHRRLIDAYVQGINAGLADLGARPPEYLLLRSRPEPWTAEDTVLVLCFFMHSQSISHVLEKPLGVMAATLPPALFDFLTPDTSRFDAPLAPDTDTVRLPIPGPDVIDLRGKAPASPGREVVRPLGTALPGSNNWAVAGHRTSHGGAILANDPHLLLRVPNVWYRVKLVSPDGTLQGAGPPGIPGVVIGCNDYLAWGVTNSLIDQNDWVVIETDPADPSRYRTPDGWEPFELVDGGATRLTRWGPVVFEDWSGRPWALRSPALLDGGFDFTIFDLFTATSIEQAVEALRKWRGPSLNWLIAQRDGRIGWVLGGYLPNRVGFTGKFPTSWADGSRRWDGELDESLRPVIIDPPGGVLFTANNRTVPIEHSRRLGHSWVLPVRADRIAELLGQRETFTERDLLDIQLDTRSKMHDLARQIILEIVDEDESDERLARVRRYVTAWNGHADLDQPGFRVVAVYYDVLQEQVLKPLLAPAIEADRAFLYNWPLADESMQRLLETRPDHMCYDPWPVFLRRVLVETIELIEAGDGPGLDASWGEVNIARITHPIAGALPALGSWFNMPADPLAGARSTVRVATPNYGATLRVAVSPGHTEAGLFHMPAGQSGHLLSPHYRDGHKAWVDGLPTPFEPGPAVSSFTLD